MSCGVQGAGVRDWPCCGTMQGKVHFSEFQPFISSLESWLPLQTTWFVGINGWGCQLVGCVGRARCSQGRFRARLGAKLHYYKPGTFGLLGECNGVSV